MNKDLNAAVEAAKATPPVGVVAAHFYGLNMNDLVLYGSGLLIALQIFFLLKKEVYLPWKEKRKNG